MLRLGFEIPCLKVGDSFYPLYQFRLANHPADSCTEPHWHSGLVFPIRGPATGGRNDPDGSGCGYGKRSDLEPTTVFVTQAEWEQFLADNPPS